VFIRAADETVDGASRTAVNGRSSPSGLEKGSNEVLVQLYGLSQAVPRSESLPLPPPSTPIAPPLSPSLIHHSAWSVTDDDMQSEANSELPHQTGRCIFSLPQIMLVDSYVQDILVTGFWIRVLLDTSEIILSLSHSIIYSIVAR
jgi:hypothetical protein